MQNLSGKVAVVIGCSASRGTGWNIATALADAGARVVVAARSLDKVEELARKIGGTAVACYISVEQQVINVAEAALSTYGGLDMAVNAAGLAD